MNIPSHQVIYILRLSLLEYVTSYLFALGNHAISVWKAVEDLVESISTGSFGSRRFPSLFSLQRLERLGEDPFGRFILEGHHRGCDTALCGVSRYFQTNEAVCVEPSAERVCCLLLNQPSELAF